MIFASGAAGQASAEWCAQQAAQFGFSVDLIEPVPIDGERVSSGRVRDRAASRANLPPRDAMLGRGYSMRGRVRLGNRFGRTIGFPTANLPVKRRRVPLTGVFAVRVSGAGLALHPGVASLGTRPMVQGREMLLEAHLFDFDGDLYGRELEVEFVARLRDELTLSDRWRRWCSRCGRDAARSPPHSGGMNARDKDAVAEVRPVTGIA